MKGQSRGRGMWLCRLILLVLGFALKGKINIVTLSFLKYLYTGYCAQHLNALFNLILMPTLRLVFSLFYR